MSYVANTKMPEKFAAMFDAARAHTLLMGRMRVLWRRALRVRFTVVLISRRWRVRLTLFDT
jgi:hypothetical protein